jgi:excinuclease UvrABC ATPase subunit
VELDKKEDTQELEQMITNLKVQIEEDKRIEETLKQQLESAAGKVRQKNHGRKNTEKKSRQKKCDRKIAATTWLGSIYERYDTSCLRYVL